MPRKGAAMGILQSLQLGTRRPLRVAAYCRVSTEDEMQQGSFESQRKFFTEEIHDHPDWVLVSIYGDKAKTGTSTEHRFGFRRMLQNAEAGTIDYIITKSISRFSRSTTDTIITLRKLKSKGIGVYFMEQQIDTLSEMGQMVIDTMATIAEMESSSISQNITMSLDIRNEQGYPMRRAAYGYDKKGKNWHVNDKEAIRVRLAFLMAAEGYTFQEIASRLNQFEELDKSGREWTYHSVRNCLTNEAYVGDVLTNKHLVIWNGLARKEVLNIDLKDQFYVSNHHDPLIGRDLFEKMQEMFEARMLAGQKDFAGVEGIRPLAKRDSNLDGVRKFLPRKKGRFMEG